MSDHVYEPERTALLVVDPYNDFMSEGGKLYERTKPSADSVNFYGHMRALIPAFRAARIQVITVPHHRLRPGDFEKWAHVNPSQQRMKDTHSFEEGSWGAGWHPEFGPQEGDIIVTEHWAQNGFANTDLQTNLVQLGIENVVVVGFIANTCVDATARYAMELGFHVTVVPDAVGAFDEAGMQAARTTWPMYAHAILTTDELIAKLAVSAVA